MFNSISSLTSSICKELKSLCGSDINDLRYVLSKEYTIARQVSIVITQEEYNEYIQKQ